jgi:hypothetical protein
LALIGRGENKKKNGICSLGELGLGGPVKPSELPLNLLGLLSFFVALVFLVFPPGSWTGFLAFFLAQLGLHDV